MATGIVATLLCVPPMAALGAASSGFGGDVRYFQFLAVEEAPGPEDAERLALRFRLERELSARWRLELHGLLEGAAPPAVDNRRAGDARQDFRLLDLEWELATEPDLEAVALLDRLALRFEGERIRLILGRQAITWGVNYFWPVLDLFGPFRPEQVDRDYKPGVDAVRAVVPLGEFSEAELLVAGQGDDLSEDLSWGGLARLHAGAVDYGFMAGGFHGDRVLGAFLAADLAGTGLRAEVAFTDAEEPAAEGGTAAGPPVGAGGSPAVAREEFWRATVGVDRLLTAETSLTAELHFNGFGSDRASSYPLLAVVERVRRGEVTSLARRYGGISLSHRFHPLLQAAAAVLVNVDDGSVLLQPSGSWSLSDESVVLLGAFLGFGDDLDANGALRSEYGATPVTLWAAYKLYF